MHLYLLMLSLYTCFFVCFYPPVILLISLLNRYSFIFHRKRVPGNWLDSIWKHLSHTKHPYFTICIHFVWFKAWVKDFGWKKSQRLSFKISVFCDNLAHCFESPNYSNAPWFEHLALIFGFWEEEADILLLPLLSLMKVFVCLIFSP